MWKFELQRQWVISLLVLVCPCVRLSWYGWAGQMSFHSAKAHSATLYSVIMQYSAGNQHWLQCLQCNLLKLSWLLFAPVLPMSLIAVNLLTNSAFCNCAWQLSTKIILVLSCWQNQEVSKDAPSISSHGGGFYIITSTEALCELTLSNAIFSSLMLVLPCVATLSCQAWVPLFTVKHDDDET